jgi:membrane associated rhomboid family serine protease
MHPIDQIGEVVYSSHDRRQRDDRALVLRAVGIDYVTHTAAGEFLIIVPAREVARAQQELSAYEKENPATIAPAMIESPRPNRISWPGLLIFVVLLPTFHYMHLHLTGGIDWLVAGKTHAGMILHGQLWRTVTALTLHSGVSHLIGNLIVGAGFAHFVSQRLGTGVAWFGIVIGGAFGNFINAVIQPTNHTSIGASTAVFAALGITSAIVWRTRSSPSTAAWVRYAPIIAGIILLGFLGTGGERTDVAAHIAGFATGIGLGVTFARLERRFNLGIITQITLGVATLVLIAASWAAAVIK